MHVCTQNMSGWDFEECCIELMLCCFAQLKPLTTCCKAQHLPVNLEQLQTVQTLLTADLIGLIVTNWECI